MTVVGQIGADALLGLAGAGTKGTAAVEGGSDGFAALVAALSAANGADAAPFGAKGPEAAPSGGVAVAGGSSVLKILVPEAANRDLPDALRADAGVKIDGPAGVKVEPAPDAKVAKAGLPAGTHEAAVGQAAPVVRSTSEVLVQAETVPSTSTDTPVTAGKPEKGKKTVVEAEAEAKPDMEAAASLLALIGAQAPQQPQAAAEVPAKARATTGGTVAKVDGASAAPTGSGAGPTIVQPQPQSADQGTEGDREPSSDTSDRRAGTVQAPTVQEPTAQEPTASSQPATTHTTAAPVTGPAQAAAPTDIAASLSDTVIDMGVGGQWIDRMATEISQLASGTGHARFQLSPPHLGRIQVDVWQGADGGRVQMLAETDEATRRLSDGQSTLQADARLQALSLSSISVQRAPEGSFDASRDPNAGSNASAQSQQQQQQQQQQQAPSPGQQRSDSSLGGQSGSGAGMGQHAQQQGASSDQGKAAPRPAVINQRTDRADADGRPVRGQDAPNIRYA